MNGSDTNSPISQFGHEIRSIIKLAIDNRSIAVPDGPDVDLISAGVLDSLTLEHVISDIERKYRIAIPPSDVAPQVTLAYLCSLVGRHLTMSPSS